MHSESIAPRGLVGSWNLERVTFDVIMGQDLKKMMCVLMNNCENLTYGLPIFCCL